MTAAAMQADYTDLKFIKTRKVCQVTLEIPIEQGEMFVKAFGTPNPANGVPVAIARIKPEANGKPVASEAKERRSWDDLSLAQQAGILCGEGSFLAFLRERYQFYSIQDQADAATALRDQCAVQSRSELDSNPQAAAKFLELEREYKAWLTVPV
jgi:hypothetical protein